MLNQLHDLPAHPSTMSAGTLLSSGPATMIPVKAEDTASALHLESDRWRVDVEKNPWEMTFTNKQTGLFWRLPAMNSSSPGLSWAQRPGKPGPVQSTSVEHIERRGNNWHMQVRLTGFGEPAEVDLKIISADVLCLSVRAPQLGNNAQMNLAFAGAGPFYGLGERFDRVKLDGLTTTLRPEDRLGEPGHNWTYIPVPFLFSPRGLGIYLDTGAVSRFDLGSSDDQKFSIQLASPSVDCYFFVGDPKSIIENYTALTGRTQLSPPWAYGVWICSYQGPEQVLKDALRLRQEKIPSSAIWIFDVMEKGDIMGWPLWWTGYYPKPRQLVDQLHSMGFKVLTYVHPYLRSVLYPYNIPDPSYEQGIRQGLMVHDAQGHPTGPAKPFPDGNIDFTSSANVNWWEQKIRNIVINDNFDGWMEDYGEWINDTDHFAAGVTGREMQNLYPLFYHKVTDEIARKAKPDVVEFDRSGYAGSQGYTPVIWGGDQLPNWSEDRGLPSVVRGGITAGLSGFSVWGPDIEDNTHSRELWTRWVEFGALTPIMRNHLWNKPAGAVTLWTDDHTIDTFRRYAGLHMSLFPYLYTYAVQATKSGIPIMRDPMLESPADPRTYDLDAEYMLGDKMLVAPVIAQGATSRSLYLPQGNWVNYWTGDMMGGGREVTVDAPLEQIPIFVRSGSILPFINPDTETLAQNPSGSSYQIFLSDLTWRVFPADAPFQDRFAIFDGTVGEVNEQASQTEVRVERSPGVRRYQVVLPEGHAPRQVLLGGKPLAEMRDSGGQSGTTGWQMDPEDRTLRVVFSAIDFDLSVKR
jgi:alpha-glucosidase (family GH31 glycosyl hydrolase)